MGPYGFSLALGVTGLVVMAILGFSHHGDTGVHAGHVGHGGHGGHGGHHVGDGHHGHAGQPGHDVSGKLFSLLSPRVLFSFLVGAGAAGMVADRWLAEPFTAAVALAGGVLFERLLIRPIWNLLFRFESRPAAMLESVVMDEATAATDFDAEGHGLIQLELDGQVVQLLGTLTAEDQARVRRVRRGDLLRIEDVDAARNRCTVSFAGERPPEALP